MVCTGVDEKVDHDFSSRHMYIYGLVELQLVLKMYDGVDWIRLTQYMVEWNVCSVVQKCFEF